MKSASAALASHLGQDSTTLATCWKIKRHDGSPQTILGFTDHDQDLAIDLGDGDGTITYRAATGYSRDAIKSYSDFKVPEFDIEGFLDSTAITEDDLRAGRYDFADVRIFLVNWKDLSQGVLKLSSGQLGEVVLREGQFVAEMRGLLSRYHSQKIVELVTPDCRADLGDGRCKVQLDPPVWTASTEAVVRPRRDAQLPASASPAAFNVVKPTTFNDRHFICVTAGTTGGAEPAWNLGVGGSPVTTTDGGVVWEAIRALTIEGTVASVTDNRQFGITYSGDAPESLFTGGVLTWTSGLNKDLKAEVKQFQISPYAVALFLPAVFDVAVADAFEISAGCDKTLATCRDTFDNIHNFRGEPHVPGNDLMFKTPDAPS